MTFRQLQLRLRRYLQEKARHGEISQRQLALATGFTQPHIHNVLKGARKMNPELADALLEHLDLTVLDLLDDAELGFGLHLMAPLASGLVGPHEPFPERLKEGAHLLFPAAFLARFVKPILLRLDADEDTMSPVIEPGDIVLVDRAEPRRSRPVFDGIYVLSFGGRGAVCRCQLVGGVLVLVGENSRRPTNLPESLAVGRQILDIVRGRVVWVCREFGVIFSK